MLSHQSSRIHLPGFSISSQVISNWHNFQKHTLHLESTILNEIISRFRSPIFSITDVSKYNQKVGFAYSIDRQLFFFQHRNSLSRTWSNIPMHSNYFGVPKSSITTRFSNFIRLTLFPLMYRRSMYDTPTRSTHPQLILHKYMRH